MNKNLKVCVIGGGIFGLTTSIHLSKYCSSIKVFEKKPFLLDGATKYNHNRHHFGFHYPRSLETATQCLEAKKDFDKNYKSCIDYSFNNFYAISNKNSKITNFDFENFCDKASLKLSTVNPPNELFHVNQISKCYKVREGVYDFNKIRTIVTNRINSLKNIKVIKNAKVTTYVDQEKIINYSISKKKYTEKFDLVINATYDKINEYILNDKIEMEYNLQEMCQLEINTERFGSTILDGEFPSILPIAGAKNQYLFAHVKYSQLVKIKSKTIPKEIFKEKKPSQINLTLKKSEKYLKILNKSKLIGSFRIIRAVNIDKKSDSRKSEIIQHKNGNLSIFSGKIITVETIAKNISKLIKSKYK